MKLSIGNSSLELLPGHGVLLEDRTLVVSDVHLGKAAAFQAKGLAVPEGDTEADLTRLLNLSHEVQARRLIINGDLFHSPAGISPRLESLLQQWIEKLGIPVELVIGNHEEKFKRLPDGLNPARIIDCNGFHLVHDPADAPDGVPTICGHWHPVARIADGKRTSLRLPCFLLRHEMLVLPSFGTFTGGRIVEIQKNDRVFVAPGAKITEVPEQLLR
ncbi:ligase-associated DNA damage response endonuclease PdeM [Luteolibacter pohnpeiensis]|uniref:Ligase-associated DNA damage response endonuclease PdeM n=1 Tax=Luteolibacter pohnpeiensis TaxID=454153 RepID=A0A934S808_9BACT|nr:ligase-associated DNA damage response endonuclease PdeM [Luteolibacter pohnpeiensis]MBK1883877.1 ligase-associated DNA damage response endonuclease PdeM [Luteolibacter pohnpeiensis]